MSSKTELREAINEVFIEGVLKEKNLEIIPAEMKNSSGSTVKTDAIRGELVIASTEDSEHKVKVYAYKLTKDGKDNSVFKGLKTVMDEYVSIAEALKSSQTADAADKVRVTKGRLGLNDYYLPNGELRSYPQINTNFVNRVKEGTYNPKAEFSLEVYFDSITPEIKDSEETGRLLVKVIVPMYGGEVIPLTLVATDEDTINYIQTNYEAKKTGKIWGEFFNSVKITKTVEQGFGKAKEKITTNTINELILVGGEETQYEDDDEKSYSTELIKKAMAERDIKLDELLKKSKDGKSGGKTAGKSSGGDKPKRDLKW
jgi:hypothetical protein